MNSSPQFSSCAWTRAKFLALCLAVGSGGHCLLAADEAVADLQPAATRLVRAHDPSTIVKCKDEYWFFCTGRGLPSYRSKDLRVWAPGPHVMTNSPPWV